MNAWIVAIMVKIDYDRQMELCQKNAERFYEDARIVCDAKSYGHALALCILGMEEIGKKLILSTIKTGQLSPRIGLSLIHDHAWKLFDLELFTSFARGSDRKYEELGLPSPTLDEKARRVRYIPILAKVKELGLYVDPLKGTNPFDPRLKSWAKVAIDALPVYLNLMPSTGAASMSEKERNVLDAVLAELLSTHRLRAKYFKSAMKPAKAT